MAPPKGQASPVHPRSTTTRTATQRATLQCPAFPQGAAKMAVEGACWYDRNVEGLPAPTGDDQYVRFGEPSLHRFIRWVGELFSVKTPELRRQTIVAAMYG